MIVSRRRDLALTDIMLELKIPNLGTPSSNLITNQVRWVVSQLDLDEGVAKKLPQKMKAKEHLVWFLSSLDIYLEEQVARLLQEE